MRVVAPHYAHKERLVVASAMAFLTDKRVELLMFSAPGVAAGDVRRASAQRDFVKSRDGRHSKGRARTITSMDFAI